MPNKKTAYFMGGGGVNEPTPGKKKYKSDPAILVQPRFEEPFYRNYDYLDTEGISGPAQYGPGSGYAHMNEFKSIKEFLAYRRQRLKGKYVADDFWIEDTEANRKQRVEKMKVRASLLDRIVKRASSDCEDSDVEYSDSTDAFICGKCFHMSENCKGNPTPSAKELHAGKNHNPKRIDWRDGVNRNNRQSDPNYIEWQKNVSHDKNDGRNFDYGTGLYMKMDKYDSVEDFRNGDKNSIDFDIDSQINQGTNYPGASDSFEKPDKLGPAGKDLFTFPTSVEDGDVESYPYSAQIGGLLDKYLPLNDFEGKPDSDLDVGRDYTEDAEMPSELSLEDLERLSKKYLMPKENGLFGLPDGISPPDDIDPNATVNEPNPELGETESGNTMYEDKWNI